MHSFLLRVWMAQTGAKSGRVDHSTCGAVKAHESSMAPDFCLRAPSPDTMRVFPTGETESSGMSGGCVNEVGKPIPLSRPPDGLLSQALPSERPKQGADPSMWIRMLFSCLVDADCLNSEAFGEPAKARLREEIPFAQGLLPMFEDFMRKKQASSRKTTMRSDKSRSAEPGAFSRQASSRIFSLTVPTGGGEDAPINGVCP